MPLTTVDTADLASALSAYAGRLHARAERSHHVASPLGAWMLLALSATGSEGRLRAEVSAILGLDVGAAAGLAETLLAHPHPAVGFATGVWTGPSVTADMLAGWLARLPVGVERGPLPTKSALDAWARKHTRGMIARFPGAVSPTDLLILASALATKVTWKAPFDSIAAAQRGLTGSTMWSGDVDRVMKAPVSPFHTQFIAATERAGDVAVHVAEAREGMSVTSVIAAPDVPPSDVIAAAYRIACGLHVEKRSLFDLPLGNSPMWRITEQRIETVVPGARVELCEAVLPSWRAETTHDLRRADLGFPAVAAAIAPLVRAPTDAYEATQAAAARYGLKGFVAASVNVIRTLGMLPRPARAPGLRRTATLQFGHPYAVVAVTTDRERSDRTAQRGPWGRLPVYSAWVAEPTEVDERL